MNDLDDSKAFQIVEGAIRMPGVRVDRDSFLAKTFKGLDGEKLTKVINEGPHTVFTLAELDKKASKIITKNVSTASTASFITGLPSNLAIMLGTSSLDIMQYYANALRMAQELGYIYGVPNLLDSTNELNEEGKTTLMLYLGSMFGVSVANFGLMFVSRGMGGAAQKKILNTAVTKTTWYPLLKEIAKVIGLNVTKKGTAQVASKAIPIIGGVVSGGLTYSSMKPMGKRLKDSLSGSVFVDDVMVAEAMDEIKNNLELIEYR